MPSPEELAAKVVTAGTAPSAVGGEVVDAGLQELRDAIAGECTLCPPRLDRVCGWVCY